MHESNIRSQCSFSDSFRGLLTNKILDKLRDEIFPRLFKYQLFDNQALKDAEYVDYAAEMLEQLGQVSRFWGVLKSQNFIELVRKLLERIYEKLFDKRTTNLAIQWNCMNKLLAVTCDSMTDQSTELVETLLESEIISDIIKYLQMDHFDSRCSDVDSLTLINGFVRLLVIGAFSGPDSADEFAEDVAERSNARKYLSSTHFVKLIRNILKVNFEKTFHSKNDNDLHCWNWMIQLLSAVGEVSSNSDEFVQTAIQEKFVYDMIQYIQTDHLAPKQIVEEKSAKCLTSFIRILYYVLENAPVSEEFPRNEASEYLLSLNFIGMIQNVLRLHFHELFSEYCPNNEDMFECVVILLTAMSDLCYESEKFAGLLLETQLASDLIDFLEKNYFAPNPGQIIDIVPAHCMILFIDTLFSVRRKIGEERITDKRVLQYLSSCVFLETCQNFLKTYIKKMFERNKSEKPSLYRCVNNSLRMIQRVSKDSADFAEKLLETKIAAALFNSMNPPAMIHIIDILSAECLMLIIQILNQICRIVPASKCIRNEAKEYLTSTNFLDFCQQVLRDNFEKCFDQNNSNRIELRECLVEMLNTAMDISFQSEDFIARSWENNMASDIIKYVQNEHLSACRLNEVLANMVISYLIILQNIIRGAPASYRASDLYEQLVTREKCIMSGVSDAVQQEMRVNFTKLFQQERKTSPSLWEHFRALSIFLCNMCHHSSEFVKRSEENNTTSAIVEYLQNEHLNVNQMNKKENKFLVKMFLMTLHNIVESVPEALTSLRSSDVSEVLRPFRDCNHEDLSSICLWIQVQYLLVLRFRFLKLMVAMNSIEVPLQGS